MQREKAAASTSSAARWLSAAGGVSVAHVFVHLLSELASKPGELNTAGLPKDHTDIFLLALAGLVTFYGLERLAKVHGRAAKPANTAHQKQGVFWLHICSFSLYNALIAYLLVDREDAEVRNLLLYGLALGLHLKEELPDERESRFSAFVAGVVLYAGVVML